MAIDKIIKKASGSESGGDVSKTLKAINDANNKNSQRIVELIKDSRPGVIESFSPSAIKAIKKSIMPGIEARTEAKRNIFGFKKRTTEPTKKFFSKLFQKYFGESGTPKWMQAIFLTLGGNFIYFFQEIKMKLLDTMKAFTSKGLFAKIRAVLKENKFITKILESLKSIKGRIGNWATRIWTSVKGVFGAGGEGKGKGPKWLQSLRNMKNAVGSWAGRLWASVKGVFGMGDKAAVKKGPTFIERLKGIKNAVGNFFAKLIAPFKGFFGGAATAAEAGPKKPGKVMQILTKIMDVVKQTRAGKFLKVVARFFPFLIPILAVWETIKGITGGWKEVEEANPEASVIEKLGGAFKGGLKAIWKFFVTDFVDMIGGAAKWLVGKALGFLGFDKAEETIKKQDWNFGTKLEEWIGKAWGWIKGIFGFGDAETKKVEGAPDATETEGDQSLMGFVKSSVSKVWGWIKTLFSFSPLGLVLDKLPGLDITGMLKGLAKSLLGPVIDYEGWGSGVVQSLIPKGLSKWMNAPSKPSKPIIAPVGLGQLKKDEGFKKKAYKDTKGIDTIGFGFNLERGDAQDALKAAGIDKSVADLRSGNAELSEEEADRLMRGEYPHFADIAKRFVGQGTWDKLTLDRQKVLTNMAYNLGEGGLNKFKKLKAALVAGDYQEAGQQMMESDWAGQVHGRAGRLATRMSNTSGSQLAASATEGGNLGTRFRAGGGTNVFNNTNNESNTYTHQQSATDQNQGTAARLYGWVSSKFSD